MGMTKKQEVAILVDIQYFSNQVALVLDANESQAHENLSKIFDLAKKMLDERVSGITKFNQGRKQVYWLKCTCGGAGRVIKIGE